MGKESSDSPLGSSSRSMNHRGLDEIDNANTLVSADSLLRLFFFTFAIHAEVCKYLSRSIHLSFFLLSFSNAARRRDIFTFN